MSDPDADGVVIVRDGRRKGWFPVDNVVIDQYARHIGVSALAVYVALCRRTNNHDGEAVVRVGWLASTLGMGDRTVREKLRVLESYRMVAVRPVVRDGGQRASEYTLLELGRVVDGASIKTPATTALQNLQGVQNLQGAPAESAPPPAESAGPIKTTPYLNNFPVKEALPLRQITKLLMDVKAYLRDGWTIAALIEAGMLDAAEWDAARSSTMHKAMLEGMR